MIVRTVHLPHLFRDVPADPRAAELYCSLVLGLLRDMQTNCVLLLDPNGIMFKEMGLALADWPIKYRRKAQETLRKLENRNRIVAATDAYLPDTTCRYPGCQHALGIAACSRPAAVFGPLSCGCRRVCGVSGVSVLALGEYAVSPFVGRRRQAEFLELGDREWTRQQFEARVWEPLFRSAKHVKLFDRMLGHTFTGRLRGTGGGRPVALDDNYTRTLQWIFSQFLAHAPRRPNSVFEVTCGLEANRLTPAEQAAAAAALRRFASDLSAHHGFQLTMIVKQEHAAALRHARFLFTDQVQLQIDRGFDLLRSDHRVRDVMIAHVQDPGKIEAEVRKLPDAP